MEKGLIYSEQGDMFGKKEIVGYSSGFMHVKEIIKNRADEVIKKNHYSGKVYNGTYIHLGVFINDRFVGVLQYGYAMNPASCSSIVYGTEINQYLELNRMWIDDCAGANSESMAFSCSLKYIKNKYPKIKWIQSFADERCGCFGIVYQACSFNYYGEHVGIFWELDDVWYHNTNATLSKNSKRFKNNVGNCKYLVENLDRAKRFSLRQFRYIKFLDISWKKKCLLDEKKYPKYYNEPVKKIHDGPDEITVLGSIGGMKKAEIEKYDDIMHQRQGDLFR